MMLEQALLDWKHQLMSSLAWLDHLILWNEGMPGGLQLEVSCCDGVMVAGSLPLTFGPWMSAVPA